MRICFPIEKDDGLASTVYGHFGSAPMFLLVDTESNQATAISKTAHHSHGACKPVGALSGQQVDSIVVGDIGVAARIQLQSLGLRIFKAQGATVRENIEKIAFNTLPEFGDHENCGCQGKGGCCQRS